MTKEKEKNVGIILTSTIAVLIILIVSIVVVILVRALSDEGKVKNGRQVELDTQTIVIEETDGVVL